MKSDPNTPDTEKPPLDISKTLQHERARVEALSRCVQRVGNDKRPATEALLRLSVAEIDLWTGEGAQEPDTAAARAREHAEARAGCVCWAEYQRAARESELRREVAAYEV